MTDRQVERFRAARARHHAAQQAHRAAVAELEAAAAEVTCAGADLAERIRLLDATSRADRSSHALRPVGEAA